MFARPGKPVFELQSRYPLEFANVVRDEHQMPGACLPGYQGIVWTDRRTGRHQVRTNLAGMLSILDIEGHDLELKRLDTRDIRSRSLALVRAEIELVRDDRRHPEISRLVRTQAAHL